MTSRIIGKLPLDPGPLQADLATIQSFPRIEEAYDEFSSGYWKNCSLWNVSGEAEDTAHRDTSGPAQQTEYGKRLAYLSRLVQKDNPAALHTDEQAVFRMRPGVSKIHFRRDAAITSTYDWLVIAAQASGDHSLVTKAGELRRYMVEKRSMGERFTLAPTA